MSRPRALTVYRQLLRTLQRWPSIKRDTVAAEVRAEFRLYQQEAEPEKRAKQLEEAEAGLRALRQQCGLSESGSEIGYNYDEALRDGRD